MNIGQIGEAIRKARKESGTTLIEMASDLGLGYATLSRLESGKLANDFGAFKLLRCIEYVGLDMKIIPKEFGYTLDDARADNIKEGFGAPGL